MCCALHVWLLRVHWLAPNGVIRQHVGSPCGTRRHRHAHTGTHLAVGPPRTRRNRAGRTDEERIRSERDVRTEPCLRARKGAHPSSRTHTHGARPRVQSRTHATLLSGRRVASRQDATCNKTTTCDRQRATQRLLPGGAWLRPDAAQVSVCRRGSRDERRVRLSQQTSRPPRTRPERDATCDLQQATGNRQ